MNLTTWNRIRYSIYAPFYDMALRGFDGHRKRSIDQLGDIDGKSVLIVGAGTGLDLEYIPEGVKITATDITPGMIAKLDRKAVELGIDVESMVMDGQKLEFKDDSFDHVVLHLIIAVIPDPDKCIKEVERVLRPGGSAVVFDKFIHKGSRPNMIRKLLNIFTSTFFSDINRSIEDIVSETSLEIVSDTPVAFGGSFRVLLLKKN